MTNGRNKTDKQKDSSDSMGFEAKLRVSSVARLQALNNGRSYKPACGSSRISMQSDNYLRGNCAIAGRSIPGIDDETEKFCRIQSTDYWK